MVNTVSVLGNLRIAGAIVLDKDEASFPLTPKPGTLIIKGAALYAYITINGMETWYPLVRDVTSSYVHTQGIPSLVFTVNHNLNTSKFWYQIQDVEGNIITPLSVETIDNNSFQVNFSEATVGTVLVVGTTLLDVPNIKAELIEIGSNVTIDTAGLWVNGVLIGSDVVAAHEHNAATVLAAGFMSAVDKVKLDGIQAGAGNYTHPANHPASIITQDAANRFVSDAEKATWDGKVGATDEVTLTNKTIEAAVFTNGYTEESVSENTGTAYTIDLLKGTLQSLTLTGNCSFTLPALVSGKSFVLLLKQDANGNRTAGWPGSVKWPGGVSPTITAAANKMDKMSFLCDGVYWYGTMAGQNY